MTISQMYDYIASLVDDLNFGYFTQPQLLRYINQSAQETQKRLIQSGNNWYLKVAQQITVTNQADYLVPCDFLKMNQVALVQNPGLNEQIWYIPSVTLNEANNFPNTNTDVCCFYLRKNRLILAPYPKDASKYIRINYTYRIAQAQLSNDIVDVPEEFHEYIVYLSAIKCFTKDGREASLLKMYTDEVERNLDKDAIERNQDHGSRVVYSSEDNGFTY